MSNVVPFEKYKGQPVEAMMADPDYCAWAINQPGPAGSLLRPVHRHRRRRRRARRSHPRAQPDAIAVSRSGHAARGLPVDRRRGGIRPEVDKEAAQRSSGGNRRLTAKAWRQIIDEIRQAPVKFEVHGWDVFLGCGEGVVIELKPMMGDDYPAVLRAMMMRVEHDLRQKQLALRQQYYRLKALIVDRSRPTARASTTSNGSLASAASR